MIHLRCKSLLEALSLRRVPQGALFYVIFTAAAEPGSHISPTVPPSRCRPREWRKSIPGSHFFSNTRTISNYDKTEPILSGGEANQQSGRADPGSRSVRTSNWFSTTRQSNPPKTTQQIEMNFSLNFRSRQIAPTAICPTAIRASLTSGTAFFQSLWVRNIARSNSSTTVRGNSRWCHGYAIASAVREYTLPAALPPSWRWRPRQAPWLAALSHRQRAPGHRPFGLFRCIRSAAREAPQNGRSAQNEL